MELSKELSSERMPSLPLQDNMSDILLRDQSPLPELDSGRVGLDRDRQAVEAMSHEELTERVEEVLLERINAGEKAALFQLAQLYFEQEEYDKAQEYFERAADKGDYQAMFQLGVLLFDGLVGEPDQMRGFDYMLKVATSSSKKARHLQRAAQYNIGRAYYQGCGVRQSNEDAEKFWVLAADDGNPKASIKAQTTLGLFFASPDYKDLKKSFFWHSEACGNGSLESQGALGVMYLNGLGCKKNANSSFICLREASERGNVYAMGNLVAYYYSRKLYTKTVELAARLGQLSNPEEIARETDCVPSFVAKGIAIGCFFYARCLHLGLGIKKDEAEAKNYYSKSYSFDAGVCANLQNSTQQGQI